MPRPLSTEARLRNRVRDLERRQDSWHVAVDNTTVWAYLEQLAALHHLAHNALRRPDDLGGSISGSHAASKAPAHDLEAHMQLAVELRHLAARARMIEASLNGHKVA